MKSYTYVVIADSASDRNNEGEQIFAGSRDGEVIQRMTVTNIEGAGATVNIYKVAQNGIPVRIIGVDTSIAAGATLSVGGSLVLTANQKLIVSTDKTLHIDINII